MLFGCVVAFYESEWKKYDAAYQQLMTEHKRLSKQMEVTRRAIAKKVRENIQTECG